MQSGFGILRTWRMLDITILTLIIYLPDVLSLWFLVKAVGLALGLADLLIHYGSCKPQHACAVRTSL